MRSLQRKLRHHAERLAETSAADLFAADPDRVARYSLHRDGLLADLSREPLDDAAWDSLLELPDKMGLERATRQLLGGQPVHPGEQGIALHPASRAGQDDSLPVPADEVLQGLIAERDRTLAFAEALRAGELQGTAGKPLRCLVNLGAGGADLGVRLITEAFAHLLPEGVRVLCATTKEELQSILDQLDAAETLFVINSKSLATAETLASTTLARNWLEKQPGGANWPDHAAAVSARPDRARELALKDQRIFTMRQEIGGRYSLWSPAGLAAMVTLGRTGYLELLAGARRADRELLRPWRDNLPVRLALKDFWHSQVEETSSKAVFPYPLALRNLVPYLAQLEMESLGKNCRADGSPVEGPTGAIFWGGWGPSAQHSMFQMLYQGTHRVPVELLALVGDSSYRHCLAQAEALSAGCDTPPEQAQRLPVTVLVLDEISPDRLGFTIGLWEHRVFVQAHLLGLNPFDQWGVERGKRLAARTESADPATHALIDWTGGDLV